MAVIFEMRKPRSRGVSGAGVPHMTIPASGIEMRADGGARIVATSRQQRTPTYVSRGHDRGMRP